MWRKRIAEEEEEEEEARGVSAGVEVAFSVEDDCEELFLAESEEVFLMDEDETGRENG